MSDKTLEMQSELVQSKIEELKQAMTGLVVAYTSKENIFLRDKEYQDIVTDMFLDLDNDLQNKDVWDKDEILEMAALFLLMSADNDIEQLDDMEDETSESIDTEAEEV